MLDPRRNLSFRPRLGPMPEIGRSEIPVRSPTGGHRPVFPPLGSDPRTPAGEDVDDGGGEQHAGHHDVDPLAGNPEQVQAVVDAPDDQAAQHSVDRSAPASNRLVPPITAAATASST